MISHDSRPKETDQAITFEGDFTVRISPVQLSQIRGALICEKCVGVRWAGEETISFSNWRVRSFKSGDDLSFDFTDGGDYEDIMRGIADGTRQPEIILKAKRDVLSITDRAGNEIYAAS